MKSLLDGLRTLGMARLLAMGAVGLGVLGLMAFLSLRTGNERMALLYGDLELRESAQVSEQLAHEHIPYRLESQGTQILVPEDQVTRARVLLAKQGLPSGGTVGYEIFDRGDGLTTNRFQQQINQARALEGELARTIQAIHGVRAARVHLVLPRREPFARDRQDAQASVMLTMAGGSRLDREGTQAILNLVAAAVPGLRPQNIAIVDSRGAMLARAGEPTGAAAAASTTEEIRHATEVRLSRAVEEMLERTLGAGRVRAETAVDMDFDRVNETLEKYDPDGQVVRSQQSVNHSNKTTEATTAVSVQNNLPNADAGKDNNAGTQENRQEETTNYEVSRTVRTLIREQPQIRRISLAVMVDGTEAPDASGKPVWQPRSAEDLAQITALVRGAIGFDEKRGDHVEVASMRFADLDAPIAPASSGLLGGMFERSDLLRLAQTALFALVGVLALLFVLRPMVLRLTAATGSGVLEDATAEEMEIAGALTHDGSSRPSVVAGGEVAGLLENDTMVSLANIDGQLRASSIRKIADLVEKHPEASLNIVRGWMLQEAD